VWEEGDSIKTYLLKQLMVIVAVLTDVNKIIKTKKTASFGGFICTRARWKTLNHAILNN
jgi:hypothetical protein